MRLPGLGKVRLVVSCKNAELTGTYAVLVSNRGDWHAPRILTLYVQRWPIEQDHRGVKRVTRPMLGFQSFDAAQDTLVGIELMHMIKKKQLVVEAGDEGLTAAELFYSLAA